MKIKELAEKDDKSLRKLLEETKAKLVKDRFKVASREATNVSEISKSRRLVAKIETILREREIVENEKRLTAKKAEDKQ
jgi:large subunit ribosomal protein L29